MAPIAATPNQFGTARNATRSAIAAATTASQKRSWLADDRERVIRSVQRLGAAVVAEDRDVLDANAEPTRDIDAGLDRERHARLEGLVVAADEVRMLVPVETDAVSGAVDEPFAVTGLVDNAPRSGVNGCGCRARAHGRVAGFLRSPHHVVHSTHLVIHVSADVDGARDVGAVPLPCSAEVEHDGVAGCDAATAGLVMWRRAVRTRRDDREGDLVVPFIAEERGELGADLALGPTGELALENSRVGAIRRRRHGAQRVAFVPVLPHTQLAGDQRCEPEAAAGERGLKAQDEE